MARIDLEGVGHCYSGALRAASDYALQPITHSWENGRAYALLGPSGCGKTTLLNIISGLIRPSEGRVLFDRTDVTDLPTARRNIAQVFQFPVIYDTMTVYDNLAFPLRCHGVNSGQLHAKVSEVAALLNLTDHLMRPARRLSADAKQLISLGRGLVRNDVAAILLDEPMTVIDPHLKWLLRRKLKEVNDAYNMTMILVTHDQNEALTFAEKVVVMREGRIVQIGTPQELFEKPRHTFVGYFIGSPAMNILPCRLEGDGVAVGNTRIRLPTAHAAVCRSGSRLEIGIRPEFLELRENASPDAVPVAISEVQDLGHFKIATVLLEGYQIKIKLPEATPMPAESGFLRFPPEWTRLYVDNELVEVTDQ
jgi:glycerol transport system ATP-binding protein